MGDSKILAAAVLDLLIEQRLDVFQASKTYLALGGDRRSWPYAAVFIPLTDHGYSLYEWPTYADMEYLVAARMIFLGSDESTKAGNVVARAIGNRQDDGFRYGLFQELATSTASWPAAAPEQDRLRFLRGLIARVLCNPVKPRHVFGQDLGQVFREAIPNEPLLTDLERTARTAFELYGNKETRSQGIERLVDVWVRLCPASSGKLTS